jgi:phosphoglycerol transferase MdoB-like AlkP superfamily enzyme
MKAQASHIITLAKRLGIMLLIYTICRILFFAFNHQLFAAFSWTEGLIIFFAGIRFDLSAIIYTNSLFILGHIIPGPWRDRTWFQTMLKTIFYLTNSFFLLLAVSDFGWFEFTMHRTTIGVTAMAGEFFDLLPKYLLDYWYLVVLLAGLLVLAEWLYRKIKAVASPIRYPAQLGLMVLVLGFGLLGARGGWQLRPIIPITAAQYVKGSLTPLVLNTPFTFIQSLEHQGVKDVQFFSDDELAELYPIHHTGLSSKPMQKLNVVVLIMESFSREYVGHFHDYAGHTPFLDSILERSFVCNNAFANGKHSNEGLVAITASIPALMEDPMMNSVYQNNRILGLGTILKEEGYTSAFFHGGKNGTFGFDYFSFAAGFDKYYGMEEYGNDSDFDGFWGIYDEPYFRYAAHEFGTLQEPFLAALFSLSAHHPYTVDKNYTDLPHGSLEIHQTVRYSDESLRSFFAVAKQQDWYENTLFVISADHTGPAERDYYYSPKGVYAIPIAFFRPDNSLAGQTAEFPVQQTDILPSVLDYLHVSSPYAAFGSSVFSENGKKLAIQYINGYYQLISDQYVLQFDGNQTIALFDYKADLYLQENLVGTLPAEQESLERQIKGVIQAYNQGMIKNRLVP